MQCVLTANSLILQSNHGQNISILEFVFPFSMGLPLGEIPMESLREKLFTLKINPTCGWKLASGIDPARWYEASPVLKAKAFWIEK